MGCHRESGKLLSALDFFCLNRLYHYLETVTQAKEGVTSFPFFFGVKESFLAGQ